MHASKTTYFNDILEKPKQIVHLVPVRPKWLNGAYLAYFSFPSISQLLIPHKKKSTKPNKPKKTQ